MLITGPTEEARAIEDHPMVIRVHANDVHHNPIAVAEVHVQSLDALFFHQLARQQVRQLTRLFQLACEPLLPFTGDVRCE